MSSSGLARALVAFALVMGACSGGGPAADAIDESVPTALPDPTAAAPSPAPPPTTGLEFASGQYLRVLGGEPSRSDLPVVVVLRPSDHVELGEFLPTLAAEEVLVFDAPWRPIEQGGRYPTALEEASCAVGYARDHAADFGGDPTTVTLVAHSAGSYVAALTSFALYEGDCTSSADLPDRMVGISGIYQALTPQERQDQDAGIAALIEGPIEDHPDEYADLQPATHLGENPTLRIMLIHGRADDVVPVDQTIEWHDRLREAGYQAETHMVDEADHTSLLLDDAQAPMVARWIRDFADPDETGSDDFAWPTGSPSALGFDVDALRAGLGVLEAQDSNAHNLVVVRDGAVVIDATLWPSSAGQLHDLASVTKTVVSLVIGAAIERGDIESLDTSLGAILDVPAGAASAELTLRDLLGMRSGLDCSADEGEAELREMGQSPDYVAFAAALPAASDPGETFAYCSPAYHLVSAAVSSATGLSLADYAADVLFEPLGIEDFLWPGDAQGVTHGWGDLALRALDVARIGQLTLQDGRWGQTQVLPAGYVAELSGPIATADPMLSYGLGWWLPGNGLAGAVEGIGRGGQELLVWPEQDLIVVVTGAETDGRLIAHSVAGAVLPTPVAVPDADIEIGNRFAALAHPPAANPPSRPDDAPGLGASFELEPNPLGLDRVRVVQVDEVEASVGLTVGDEVFELLVGLDGVARIASNTPTGGPVALTGTWAGAVLTVDYEEAFGPDHWTIEFDLGPGLTVTVVDLAALFPPIEISGSPTA